MALAQNLAAAHPHTLIIGIGVWSLPASLAINSVAAGVVFALWPVMWIVVNALLLYNIAVESRRFDAFRAWVLNHLPNDRRVVLVVIGFCFGALLEGISGFGTPVAISAAAEVSSESGRTTRRATRAAPRLLLVPVAFGWSSSARR